MTDAKPSILLVEDDEDLGGVLKLFLELSGFQASHALTGAAARAAFQAAAPQLCVLDVGLPDTDGFTLARELKDARPGVPFLFLTARTLKADRMRGLELGADDYVLKPFEADELVLRIRNILRRGAQVPKGALRLGTFSFDPETRILERGGQEQALSGKEAALLGLLLENPNRLLKRSEILTRIWGKEDYFLGRSMDVYLSRLRKLLAEDEALTIEGVRGVGFVLRIRS